MVQYSSHQSAFETDIIRCAHTEAFYARTQQSTAVFPAGNVITAETTADTLKLSATLIRPNRRGQLTPASTARTQNKAEASASSSEEREGISPPITFWSSELVGRREAIAPLAVHSEENATQAAIGIRYTRPLTPLATTRAVS
ncbi:hypothetical protein HPB50_020052 [Hyalomma asiaticum]|uniref:Uncharacterized protein n=1 Tax=Hyalomma asiaticum TaxID=266040 RepID=A0ACB7S7X8_HYAAI|nr:hypothetical protein HPB50_020052 [Hyalomma asiaticum]